MVRHTVRRAAALAATGALAVLVSAGPALAADSPSTTGAAVPGIAAAAVTQQTQPTVAYTPVVPWCHPHHGLLSSLLYAVDELLGALL